MVLVPSDVITNLGELAEAIGSYLGIMKALDQQEYMDGVLAKAFNQTDPVFNQHAVSRAMRQREAYGHMWEFGTVGITRGGSKYVDATKQSARLWRAGLRGTGVQKTIEFTFRPATQKVPPLIEEETGVQQSVLNRLRVNTGKTEYKFKNKAFVYESGVDVKLFPKNPRGTLFIPLKQEGMPSGYKGDVDKAEERGYVWAKSHAYSPGDWAGATGAFTGMFGAWWAGPGAELLEEHIIKQVEGDLATVADGIGGSRRMTSVKRTNIKAMAQRGEKKTRKQFTLLVANDADERAKAIL